MVDPAVVQALMGQAAQTRPMGSSNPTALIASALMNQSQSAAPAGPAPLPPQMPGGMAAYRKAMQDYPILQNQGVNFTFAPNARPGYLETWPVGETGGADYPRPQSLPLNQPGVEIYSDKTRPVDILGDVVSHLMVNTDPKIKAYYQQFQQSMTPDQNARLQDDYKWAQQHEGEKRPFNEWAATTRIPAYFRGYAFQQFPPDVNDKLYTPGQKAMFDQMMQYLGGK